ncbi:class I SAM-dependent DNA methyltransferase [Dactylosporangium sp. CA-139066]|uniref:class I SAM-dependent DNA methyltransferase n=1 Tax=Dactylosporangium sp. CA-139066 TaxID=3239930 RepID=UPI003D8F80A9
MHETTWLEDNRISYDTVADAYAEQVRDVLAGLPHYRAALAVFAEQVQAGPVADMGCGPGHVTAHLRGLGVDAFGIDVSAQMVAIARRDHPGVRFEVGSMTDEDVAGAPLGGLLSWFSLVNVPGDAIPGILAGFRRSLRPGAPLLLGFHAGEGVRAKTEGYGGRPMRINVYRRNPERVAAWLRDAGFAVEAQWLLEADTARPGAVLFARA